VADLPDRPTAYMTLGTVLNTDTSVFRAVLDGLAGAPVNLVITVGGANDPAVLGRQHRPPTVRTVRIPADRRKPAAAV
jgi:UDP:flavonoid glycosyltransferase YjiC (YdhE family)